MKSDLDKDLSKEPISVFFKEAILQTPQGLSLIAGSIINLVYLILTYFFPVFFGISHQPTFGSRLFLFSVWFVLTFSLFVSMMSINNFQSSWSMTLLIIALMWWLT